MTPVDAGKRLVIVGATGMVGGYALRYALDHAAVGGVTAVGRKPTGITHPKLNEVLHQDFADCSRLADPLSRQDAAIFCLGAYTGAVSGADLRRVTVDYAVEFARVFHDSSPRATFEFLSGSGADPTGRSRMAFARYKGEAEGCTAKTVPASDHFSGSRFHNRGNPPGYSLWNEIKIAWELRTKKKNWPARFQTKPYAAPAEPVLKGIKVLWVGHSTTLIQTPHLSVLTDPILFDSIGPGVFGLNTVTNPGLRIDSLPRIDVILISHNHYDHLDVRSLRALVDRQRNPPPMIVAGLGVGPLLKSAGFSSYSELDWGESAKVKDARVHFLEAVHTSRRSTGDTDKTLWGSFLIETPEGKIYFAGDSAYGGHFRTISERFGAPRVSLLPIGAYEPRWFMYRMHMNPEEAVRAHLDLHSQNSVAIHFGMIDNAGESYDAPVNDLIAARQAHGVEATRFVAPAYGQVFRY